MSTVKEDKDDAVIPIHCLKPRESAIEHALGIIGMGGTKTRDSQERLRLLKEKIKEHNKKKNGI